MPRYFFTIFALCCCSFLVGCGTKGPLYIPEQRYPQGAEKTPETPPASQPSKE